MEQSTEIHPLRNKLKRETQIVQKKNYTGRLKKNLPRGIIQWGNGKDIHFLLKADTLLERGQHKSAKQGNMLTKY